MESSTAVPLRIGIVGAGIAGLALAGGLRRRGHVVEVFEKAPRLMAVGAGISVAKNAVRALDELGLAQDVLGDAIERRTAVTALLLRPDGSSALRVPAKRLNLLPMTRAGLHAALATHAGEVRFGVEASVVASGAPVVVVDGEQHEFDVVVAADGVRSRSREALGLDPGLRYAGWTTWRGVTTDPFDLRGRMSETWGGGAMMGLVPLIDGRTYWFAAQHAPPGVTVEDPQADVLGRFGHWHAPIRQVIEATDPRGVIRTDAYDLAHPLRTYVHGRVALVGDAAHAMTPNLGQGANQALVDVAALVAALDDAAHGSGVTDALAAYDRRRRRPSQRVASNSRRIGQIALAEGIAGRTRERVLGALAAVTGGVRR
ncbi:monooxygenase FAD-binding protein [Xylanimonas cellulosilytica DSM 15894]|uniref:Monooxygenase FAD-binding protein n=1 Tax=Xylanimonas cellulosilytica (strain DSM 15894 / JCM 12276 / CECT 5975 / KCTC 9989 / LMG 20990 / NBRC 107835 / XIL07) TaxID=446471 RepID=D1BVR6_XYLCX|nr:FAD-dependent monooxygenase [Xylanimonas cellulosilytica]ACZ31385.1 monooxygenase FAD-binding protein [Xylanimonas cellulosilytica DSM 15894]